MNADANSVRPRTVYTTDVFDRVVKVFEESPNRLCICEASLTDEIKAVGMTVPMGGPKVFFETKWVHIYSDIENIYPFSKNGWMDAELPKAFPKDDEQVAVNFLKRYGCVWVRTPYPGNEDAYHVLAPRDRIEELWIEAGQRTKLYRLWDDLKDRFDEQELGRLVADDKEYFDALLSAERKVTEEELQRIRQQVQV